MIKIIPNKQYFLERKTNLTESPQGNKYLIWSLLNDKNEPFHPYFKCKDYFQDLFLYYHLYNDGHVKETSKEIFGFNPENFFKEIISIKENFKICLKIKKETEKVNETSEKLDVESINETVRTLNYFEELLNFPLTTYEITEDFTTAIFNFSKSWTDYPYLISLYLLLLRGSLRRQIDKHEAIVLKNLDTFEDFLKSIYDILNTDENKAYLFLKDKKSFYKSKEIIEIVLSKEIVPYETWEKYSNNLQNCHMNSGSVAVSGQIKILNKTKNKKEQVIV